MVQPKATYIPVIRTRNAELKGYENLQKTVSNRLFPLIEYTRSRRSKTNPNGAIALSIAKFNDIIGERPFIADLTSLQNQQNSEISVLLNPSNNFANWTKFVAQSLPDHCIPMIHLTLPFDSNSFKKQAEELVKVRHSLAIRVPTAYEEYSSVLRNVDELFGSFAKIVVLLDAGYVGSRIVTGAMGRLKEMTLELGSREPMAFAALASSFPSSVMQPGYGKDNYGCFDLAEVHLSDQLKRAFPSRTFMYGDYASIHPLDFDGTVTNWVPRVDCPLDSSLYYYRYRRGDGGYARAAKEVLQDSMYKRLDCWGCDNIASAARGTPQGLSPAHWIAVRLNIHITRQVLRLGN